MAAFLALDLALAGLLVTTNIGGAGRNRSGSPWFAASLAAGTLTLCAPWLAVQPAAPWIHVAFALCNAAGLLVGPCLVRHARTLVPARVPGPASRPVNLRASRRPRWRWTPAWPWLPFAAALLSYGAAAAAGTTPTALELWMAIAKAISLTVCVAVAIAVVVRGRQTVSAFDCRAPRAPWVDLGVVIGMVALGLATLPAALVGGEALARWVHDVAVLPALALALWCLAYRRLRGRPDAPTVPSAKPSPALPVVAAARRDAGGDDQILASVYAAFVARLDAECDWRDADFGLDDAAARLGLGRHLLSEAINRHVDGGFTAAVNGYRMAAFRAALATAADEEPVLAIGLRCGFGSKASLQRLVRQHCGCTPGALRSAIRATQKPGRHGAHEP